MELLSRSNGSDFLSSGPCIKNNDLCVKVNNSINIDLNCLKGLAFRVELSN